MGSSDFKTLFSTFHLLRFCVFLRLFIPQDFPNRVGAGKFAGAVNVGVDVGGGGHVGMSQPVLNHFHWDVVGQQERSAGVSQIVKAYFPQPVFFQNDLKMTADILWGD